MRTLIWNGQVYDSASRTFRPGAVVVADGRIESVCYDLEPERAGMDDAVDAAGGYIIPGLVDVHTHGRAGFDFATADRAGVGTMAKSYAQSGVTTVVPTLASAPLHEWRRAIDVLNDCRTEKGGAYLAGVHLEGRYLNPAKRGVHAPELLAKPDAPEIAALLSLVQGARHVTFAPEMDEDGSFLASALTRSLA